MPDFDLNIDKILENWEPKHAVREIIANALDEAKITKTSLPKIEQRDGVWYVQDSGRGLKSDHFLQNESPEKRSFPGVIGKFGIGLKDALAVLERHGVIVTIFTRDADITLTRKPKSDFEELPSLHAKFSEKPSYSTLPGTCVCLQKIKDADVLGAKALFTAYLDQKPLEATKYGEIYRKNGLGKIYVNGVQVNEEENFLFSYNITHLDAKLSKAMNRERQNLGRTAYTDLVKRILLESKSLGVATSLGENLQKIEHGEACEEMKWIDVQAHSVKILNSEKTTFITAEEARSRPDLIDAIQDASKNIIIIPTALREKVSGLADLKGEQIVTLDRFIQEYNESFEYEIIPEELLTQSEKSVWGQRARILEIVGGIPRSVRGIYIAKQITKPSYQTVGITRGVWDPRESKIYLLRETLASLPTFAGVLLHEAIHAKHGIGDVHRGFENLLTQYLGVAAAKCMQK
jgi:hypothetical protein